jgi:hypothetical protein
MAAINRKRFLLGSFSGFLVWLAWSGLLNFAVLASRYPAAQEAGHLLKHQSYRVFLFTWLLTIFVLSLIAAQFYVWARARLGPGLRSSLTVGPLLALAVALPIEVTTSRFTIDHMFTICWIVDLVVGMVLATLMVSWIYKD